MVQERDQRWSPVKIEMDLQIECRAGFLLTSVMLVNNVQVVSKNPTLHSI